MNRVQALRWLLFVILLVSAPAIGANAQDIRVENYKKTVDTLVGRWATAEINLARQLAPIVDELAALQKKQAAGSLTETERKRIAELQSQRKTIRDRMVNESANLRLELLIVQVQPGAPDRELIKLPGWVTAIVKAKGVPVGHGFVLVPDADFDLKALKLKSFSVGLKFDW